MLGLNGCSEDRRENNGRPRVVGSAAGIGGAMVGVAVAAAVVAAAVAAVAAVAVEGGGNFLCASPNGLSPRERLYSQCEEERGPMD